MGSLIFFDLFLFWAFLGFGLDFWQKSGGTCYAKKTGDPHVGDEKSFDPCYPDALSHLTVYRC